MSNINGSRGGSSSPANGKQNGGVALPTTNKNLSDDVERAANVRSSYKPGFAANTPNSAMKLSAGASPFKPGTTKGAPLPIHLLNHNSIADTASDQPTIVVSATPEETKNASKGKAPAQQPIGTRSNTLSPPTPAVYFTTDVGPAIEFQGGHYIMIDNLTKDDIKSWDNIMYDLSIDQMLRGMKLAPATDRNRFAYFCAFDDIRETNTACEHIEMAQTGWPVKYISQTEYAGAPEGNASPEKSSYHDGQVVFVVSFGGATTDFKADGADKTVHTLAGSFGEMRAFTQVTSASWPNLEFRVEYYKISDAKKALAAATKDEPHTTADEWIVIAKELPDYIIQASSVGANGDAAIANGMAGIRIAGTPPHADDANRAGNFTSPTGRTTWRIDENGNEVVMRPMKVLPKVGPVPWGVPILATQQRDRWNSAPSPHTPSQFMDGVNMPPRSGSWSGNGTYTYSYSHSSPVRGPVAGPQAVEIWKIENGQDVRTTVMLRNIPNRMTCRDLKRVLDQACFGKYDFSYLRIDFEKGTNVGYAFVNFADPMDIIPFVQGWAGKRWQPNNPRCVELSYATVQGYDCLVEKFRNSAIMSEYRDYRPKLWYTEHNAPTKTQVGQEAPFPGPNNLSKKQRSLDNAGQIGLYAPRSGHVSRERGRRSQFDRGTLSQMEEDKYYQNMSPIQNGHYGYANNGYANNGYANNGYGMAPRMAMGPPPPFPPMMYANDYDVNPYMNSNGFGNHQAYYGPYDGADPFGPGNYNGGYSNGYGRTNFGVGPGTPASRLRTHTNGKLGGRPKKVTSVGGPVHSPGGGYDSYGSPETNYHGPMPQVLEAEDEAGGYNNTPGPHYYPKY